MERDGLLVICVSLVGLASCGGHVSTEDYQQVSTGEEHACGLTTSGSVECWGMGTDQTTDEDGRYTDSDFDQGAPPRSGTFQQVSAGLYHTCAVKESGSLECWGLGSNRLEDEGEDAHDKKDYDQAVPPSGTFKQVSAGNNYTCGVEESGGVTCWGKNEEGESSPPSGTFQQVSSGNTYTCGVKESGELECWGYDPRGVSSPPSGSFEQVSVGWRHGCAVSTSGSVECWGEGSDPEKHEGGEGPDEDQAVPPSGTFDQVSADDEKTCAVTKSGDTKCWGETDSGSHPSATYVQISAEKSYQCAVTASNDAECWGSDRAQEDGVLAPP